MKILIVRHAEPDYEHDSITEKGWREAEYLAKMFAEKFGDQIHDENTVDWQKQDGQVYFYMSPYGRAQDTALITLKKLGRTAETLPWLKEFDYFINRPDDTTRKRIPWDWLPQDWTQDPLLYQAEHWTENERIAPSEVAREYRKVTEQFDALLAEHGYRRDGRFYRAERPNHDTIVLFCHFGVSAVLLSHLWGISPMPVWHGFCAQPSSVTTLVTEERREGIALFRMLAFGETAHLYVHEEEPSFAARFCECFTDDTRHD